MNRLLQIARKDFRDAARDRELYVGGTLFLLIGLAVGYLVGNSAGSVDAAAVPFGTLAGLTFVASLAAITLSYNQIVGKRTSGELRVLLSLPFSRTEVVYGTFLGRWALISAMSLVTIVIATVLATVMGAPVAFDLALGTVGIALTLGAVFVSLSVGLSASSVNTARAAAGAFGLFILFLFRLWEAAPIAVRYVLNGFSMPSGQQPAWAAAWGQLQPIAALRNAVVETVPDLVPALSTYAPGIPESQPVYTEPWFGALVVLAWIVLPVTVGYLKLRGADL
jgi:ABC-2 type transport system permease protein